MGLLEDLGHEVLVASTLRTYDRVGDAGRQLAIRDAALGEARRFATRSGPAPDLWFTYHAYHKAPDWIGPEVSRMLGIPYLVAEASIAGKQAGGPWAAGYEATLDGLRRASHILAMTRVDLAGLHRHLPAVPASLFPPFLDCRPFAIDRDRSGIAGRHDLNPSSLWLVAVAMMRDDIKRQSFELLAHALEHLADLDIVPIVVGDGEARHAIERVFATSAPRARFLGKLDSGEIAPLLSSADLMLWPALREAYGMAILEAQAAGLPVIACQEGGVADIVSDGRTAILVEKRDPQALAAAARTLLCNDRLRASFADAARTRARTVHDRTAAARRLAAIIEGVRQ